MLIVSNPISQPPGVSVRITISIGTSFICACFDVFLCLHGVEVGVWCSNALFDACVMNGGCSLGCLQRSSCDLLRFSWQFWGCL